jgi:hypothetical protein
LWKSERQKQGHENREKLLGSWKGKEKGGEEKISMSKGGVNLIKAQSTQVWKCQNETPYCVQLIYTNKK